MSGGGTARVDGGKADTQRTDMHVRRRPAPHEERL